MDHLRVAITRKDVQRDRETRAADRRFKLLDKRKDGKLTLDELPMTAAQAESAKRR